METQSAHSALEAKTIHTRRLTICNKSFARDRGLYVYFPAISLSGKWLQQHGFKSGQVIDIACEDGKLVITLAKEQTTDDGRRTTDDPQGPAGG